MGLERYIFATWSQKQYLNGKKVRKFGQHFGFAQRTATLLNVTTTIEALINLVMTQSI